MKISTRGRYALRLMLDLAKCDDGSYISLKTISQKQGISIKYLEQIITMLSQAGYVKSSRGPRGGYRLAMPPEYYTAGMIFRLTEGSLAPVACMDNNPNQCERSATCTTLKLFKRLDQAIRQVVDSVTLKDLKEMDVPELDLFPINDCATFK